MLAFHNSIRECAAVGACSTNEPVDGVGHGGGVLGTAVYPARGAYWSTRWLNSGCYAVPRAGARLFTACSCRVRGGAGRSQGVAVSSRCMVAAQM